MDGNFIRVWVFMLGSLCVKGRGTYTIDDTRYIAYSFSLLPLL